MGTETDTTRTVQPLSVDDDREEIIERLGLSDDASDEEIRAALEEADDLDVEDDDDAAEEEPRNLLGRLAHRRQELAEDESSGERSVDLPIPGYNNELFARFVYRPDAFDRLKKIGNKALKSRHPRKELHAAQDTLAYACEAIYVSDDEGVTLEHIDPSGEPTRFDQKLARLLDFDASNAREVVRKVFNNDLAVISMSNRVSEWMQREDEDADEDFSTS